MRQVSEIATNNPLDLESTIAFHIDERTIEDDFTSVDEKEYVFQEMKYFSLEEPSYDRVDIVLKVSEALSYKEKEKNIIVVGG